MIGKKVYHFYNDQQVSLVVGEVYEVINENKIVCRIPDVSDRLLLHVVNGEIQSLGYAFTKKEALEKLVEIKLEHMRSLNREIIDANIAIRGL